MAFNPLVVLANYHQFVSNGVTKQACVESRMILWCESGKGKICANNQWFEVQQDDFFILPWRHSLHYYADKHIPFLVAGIHIIPDAKEHDDMHFWQVAHNNRSPFFDVPWRKDHYLENLESVYSGKLSKAAGLFHLSQYILDVFTRQAPEEFLMRNFARLFLEECQATVKGSTKENESGRRELDAMLVFIEKNLNRMIDLKELTKVADISPSTVTRLFKKHLSLTPIQFINQLRIKSAQKILARTNQSISSIAKQVGLPDQFYFSKLFKAHTGTTPLAYRKRFSILAHSNTEK